MSTQQPDNGYGEEIEGVYEEIEVVYYWDEDTQMYYYWDQEYQAYVGWVEEEAETVWDYVTNGQDADEQQPKQNAASSPTQIDKNESNLSPVLSGIVSPKCTPRLSHPYEAGNGGDLSQRSFEEKLVVPESPELPGEPEVIESTVAKESVVPASPRNSDEDLLLASQFDVAFEKSDRDIEKDLEEEARKGAADRTSVRRLTRRLTMMKGKSMGEQLRVLAEARQGAGSELVYCVFIVLVEVLTDEQIVQKQKMDVSIAKARETAGVTALMSPERRYTTTGSIDVITPRATAPAEAPPAGRQEVRRGTARFGTAHFKDAKIGAGLEALLARKVK